MGKGFPQNHIILYLLIHVSLENIEVAGILRHGGITNKNLSNANAEKRLYEDNFRGSHVSTRQADCVCMVYFIFLSF